MKPVLAGGAAILAAGTAFVLLNQNPDTDASTASNPDTVSQTNSNYAADGDAAIVTAEATAAALPRAPDTSGNTSGGNPKFHPVKEACIEYDLTGQAMNGHMINCHRKYGYERYEIQATEIGFGGITQTQNQHSIFIGEVIYAIDEQAGTGKRTINPAYAEMVKAMENASPEEMTEIFLSSFGYTPTGEQKTIAGHECIVYSAATIGGACFTPKGLLLEQDVLGTRQVATKVTMSGGDEANYTLHQRVAITEGPDLSNGIGGLLEQLGKN